MTLQKNKQLRVTTKANFLVASPHVSQSPYERTVVLLVRADDQRASGIVVDSHFRESCRTLHRQLMEGSEVPPSEPRQAEMQLNVVNWRTDELLSELDQGVWFTVSGSREDILQGEDLWSDLVRRVGREVLREGLEIDEFPADPEVN